MKKQSFLKGSAILLGMVFVTKILGLMYKIPLTHLLGGTGMGYFSSAYAVFTPIFAVVVSGITSTIARMVAENYAFERYNNVRKIKKTAMLMFTFISLLATATVMLLARFLSNNIIGEPNVFWSLIGVIPSVLFATVMSVERGYFEGLRNMLPTAKSEIVETVFKLLFGLGFAYLVLNYAQTSFAQSQQCFGKPCASLDDARSFAVPYVAGASILGVSLSTGIASIYIIISGKIHGDGITKAMLSADRYTDRKRVIMKTLVKYSVPIAVATVITTLTNMIDLFTINPCIEKVVAAAPKLFYNLVKGDQLTLKMIPNFIYGSYTGLAVTIFGLVPTLTAMFGKSVLPSLAEEWVVGNTALVKKSLSSMILITTIIAIPSGIGISMLSKEILEFLYAGRVNEIAVSIMPLTVLGIGVIFLGISIPCFSVLQTIGKSSLAIFIMLVGGIIKLALNVILIQIPCLNVTGAAISTTVSQGIICLWSVGAMLSAAGIHISIKEIFVKPLFSALLCGITARLSYDLIIKTSLSEINPKFILPFSIFAGGIMYFFSLYLLCVLPKKQIKEIFSKKISKSY